jgi:hypothetical protein
MDRCVGFAIRSPRARRPHTARGSSLRVVETEAWPPGRQAGASKRCQKAYDPACPVRVANRDPRTTLRTRPWRQDLGDNPRPHRPQRRRCNHRVDDRRRIRPAPHPRARHPGNTAVPVVLRRRRSHLRGSRRALSGRHHSASLQRTQLRFGPPRSERGSRAAVVETPLLNLWSLRANVAVRPGQRVSRSSHCCKRPQRSP